MGDAAETAASRLWRDRAQLRERNEALARAPLAEESLTALTAENDRLASKNTHLGDQNDWLAVEIARFGTLNDRLAAEIALLRTRLVPDAAHVETEQQMETLKTELLSLLEQRTESSLH